MHYQTESWGSYMPTRSSVGDPLERIERLASENAVVIFSMSTCCMCHAIKRLFCGMGVNPTVHELDEDPSGKDMEKALMRLLGSSTAVPVVFIGGKLVGAMDRVMASHINGTLVPLLKDAGALWLWMFFSLSFQYFKERERKIWLLIYIAMKAEEEKRCLSYKSPLFWTPINDWCVSFCSCFVLAFIFIFIFITLFKSLGLLVCFVLSLIRVAERNVILLPPLYR